MAGDGSVDHTLGGWGDTVADCEIRLGHLATTKCQGQAVVGAFLLGDHQEARCVFVQPMDDARSFRSSDARQIFAMLEQGIDQGSGGIACRRVDHEANGFGYDEQVRVFEDHIQRDILCRHVEWPGWRLVHLDEVPGRDAKSGLPAFTIDLDPFVIDQTPGVRAGPPLGELREAAIEAGARQLFGHGESMLLAHVFRCFEIQN